MIKFFNTNWKSVPIVSIDTETTGVGLADKAVQFAAVRFENGFPVARFKSLVHPGIRIPEVATGVHGITDDMVRDAPTIEELFEYEALREVIGDAQPLAYNAPFDRRMVPRFGEPDWPWIDPLVFVRERDRFAKGPGRHKLSSACLRYGVILDNAHDAESDALAAGTLAFTMIPDEMLGSLLLNQRKLEASQWFDFTGWLASRGKDA